MNDGFKRAIGMGVSFPIYNNISNQRAFGWELEATVRNAVDRPIFNAVDNAIYGIIDNARS